MLYRKINWNCNSSFWFQGDLFSGLNDGLISRAEALAAVDIKHQGGGGPGGLPQLKHDMMYHHGMGAPPPVSRPHQVNIPLLYLCFCLTITLFFIILVSVVEFFMKFIPFLTQLII